VALRVGLDLGTHTSVFQITENGKALPLENELVPSVVGFPRTGIIPGILPPDASILFGDEALRYRPHLDLRWPLRFGGIDDLELCKVFTYHLRDLMDPTGRREIWGVLGAPANCSPSRQKDLRNAMVGVLDRMVVVPEPFLAAMGLRDDPAFRDGGEGMDPSRHSLIVDIGAGTTGLCLVRGYYPAEEDQISIPGAGTQVDEMLLQGIRQRYPDIRLSRLTARELKEAYSHVGDEVQPVEVRVHTDGRPLQIDLGDILRAACESILPGILGGIKELLTRCDSDCAESVLRNIIITGGGSGIRGLCGRIQGDLREDGYDVATTRKPADSRRLVARGALKVAEALREDQWQIPI
jgi:rod shape-determining protein MreB